jgi:hypothetical protein
LNCEYCDNPGILRVEKTDKQNEVHVCDSCWKLLKNPTTALPLIRGHLVLNLRGKIPENMLEEMINKFMGIISGWQIRN